MKWTGFTIAATCSFILLVGCKQADRPEGIQSGASGNISPAKGNLERQTAAELIRNSGRLNEQSIQVLNATKYVPCSERRQKYTESDMALMDALEMAGYIQFQESQSPQSYRGVICAMSLTDEGNKMAQLHKWSLENGFWKIKNAYKRELAEITGIIGGETDQAIAEFTWKWSLTELGEKLRLSPQADLRGGSATFQKYDDGWRLTNVSAM